MLVATWNVNSLRARMPRVEEFLDRHLPGVVLLQETKTAPDQVPHLELQAAGYTTVDASVGRWTGVAALVRDGHEIGAQQVGLPGTPVPEEARWVEVVVDGVTFVSVYVVNGRHPADPMFPVKLEFLDRMADRLAVLRRAGPVVLGGDLNIAPADVDVYDPAAFAGSTHVTDHERGRLQAMLDGRSGSEPAVERGSEPTVERGSEPAFVDAYRVCHPDEVGFTWWDYRAGHFHRGMGLRIDLFLVSSDLADGIRACGIDRSFRKGPKPSDHAPLLLELDLVMPAT